MRGMLLMVGMLLPLTLGCEPERESAPRLDQADGREGGGDAVRGEQAEGVPGSPTTAPGPRPVVEGAATVDQLPEDELRRGVSLHPQRLAFAELGAVGTEPPPPSPAAEPRGGAFLSEDEHGVLLEVHLGRVPPGRHEVAIAQDHDCAQLGPTLAEQATRAGERQAAAPPGAEGRDGPAAEQAEAMRLGHVEVGPGGLVRYRLRSEDVSLDARADDSMLGKALVVLSHPPTAAPGDAGRPLACGVIRAVS